MYSKHVSAAVVAAAISFIINAGSIPKAFAAGESCTLEANLGFPKWDEPDDLPYYGFHADWLEVWYDEDNYCDAENIPEWCTYKNTNPAPGSQSAFIANANSTDFLVEWTKQEETITVLEAAGKTTNFVVYHWYFESDYYAKSPEWKDHLMAATLTITNKSNGDAPVMESDGKSKWTHPVDEDITTHIGFKEENPNYQDKFGISVTCDDDCACRAHGYILTFEEEEEGDPLRENKNGLSAGGKAAIGIICTALILAPVSYFVYKKMKNPDSTQTSHGRLRSAGPGNVV